MSRQTQPSTLEWASRYASIGYHIFPLHGIKDGKCTCGKKTCTTPGMHARVEDWQHAATTSTATILEWLEKWPDSGIACTTGKQSNLFCISIDGSEGLQYTADIKAQFEDLGNPAVATYGEYKRNLFFNYPDFIGIPQETFNLNHQIKVSGENCWVHLPSSLSDSENDYKWLQPPCQLMEHLLDVYTSKEKNNISTSLIMYILGRADSVFSSNITMHERLDAATKLHSKIPPLKQEGKDLHHLSNAARALVWDSICLLKMLSHSLRVHISQDALQKSNYQMIK